jgi:hypothetical protein
MCNLQQSPQQLLYNLYNSVAITELKGYAMMQFSWMLLRLYKKGMRCLQPASQLILKYVAPQQLDLQWTVWRYIPEDRLFKFIATRCLEILQNSSKNLRQLCHENILYSCY